MSININAPANLNPDNNLLNVPDSQMEAVTNLDEISATNNSALAEVGDKFMQSIDKIAANNKVLNEALNGNINPSSPEEMLKLQQVAGSYSTTTGIASKALASLSRSIDTLVTKTQ